MSSFLCVFGTQNEIGFSPCTHQKIFQALSSWCRSSKDVEPVKKSAGLRKYMLSMPQCIDANKSESQKIESRLHAAFRLRSPQATSIMSSYGRCKVVLFTAKCKRILQMRRCKEASSKRQESTCCWKMTLMNMCCEICVKLKSSTEDHDNCLNLFDG